MAHGSTGVVVRERVDGPATHAIVIGVGRYPHLRGGSGPLAEEHEGMGQLTCPPISALEFATWLAGEYAATNPKPLASLRLLISAEGPPTWSDPRTARSHPVSAATSEHAVAAIKEWYEEGNSLESNRLIFYFCGHGLEASEDQSLLLEDFGGDRLSPFAGAIDFRKLRLGLDRCAAREQIFFIDACREVTDAQLESGDIGRVPIEPRARSASGRPARCAPRYHSASAGKSAHGNPNEVSIFTRALLEALRGPGARVEVNGRRRTWVIDPTSLMTGIDFLLKIGPGSGMQQRPVASDISTFPFHPIDNPEAHLLVRCADANYDGEISLECMTKPTHSHHLHRAPPAPWRIPLKTGDYQLRPHVSSSLAVRADPVDVHVETPGTVIELEVST